MALNPETAPAYQLRLELSADRLSESEDAAWANRRQHKRYQTDWPAYCEMPHAGLWAVVIVNASEGGFGLSCDLPIEIGSELKITIADIGAFPCALVWKRNGRCGVRLLPSAGSISADQMTELATGLASIVALGPKAV